MSGHTIIIPLCLYVNVGLVENMAGKIREETPIMPDKTPVIWFATKVAATSAEARRSPAFSLLYEALQNHPGAQSLRTIMSGASAVGNVVALEDVREHAGGRHDNDHADFRCISAMPTVEEVRTASSSSSSSWEITGRSFLCPYSGSKNQLNALFLFGFLLCPSDKM